MIFDPLNLPLIIEHFNLVSLTSRDEVNERLKLIMSEIHQNCVKYGSSGETVNYVNGSNISGFIKVADSMIDQGVV